MSHESRPADEVALGDVYCVTAHPYLRWVVAEIAAPNVVLCSSADESVRRTINLQVLKNPARFQRDTRNARDTLITN